MNRLQEELLWAVKTKGLRKKIKSRKVETNTQAVIAILTEAIQNNQDPKLIDQVLLTVLNYFLRKQNPVRFTGVPGRKSHLGTLDYKKGPKPNGLSLIPGETGSTSKEIGSLYPDYLSGDKDKLSNQRVLAGSGV